MATIPISVSPSLVFVRINGDFKELGDITYNATLEPADEGAAAALSFTAKLHWTHYNGKGSKRRKEIRCLQYFGYKKKPKCTYRTNKNYFKK